MLEQLLWWLFIGFIIATILGVVLYFALRWTFMRTAEKMATIVDRSFGGHAAAAFTRLPRRRAPGAGSPDPSLTPVP